ncbi:hypothetical protein LIER_28861 [Lithospermum erythrorhizon]|uniref:Uncharacterized protein n=1 Tax=Lithospermum erythrorhizon TaxID=34254 RepID=A0AAV3RH82_LITER
MGNYMACSMIFPLIIKNKAARVILPGGEVRLFKEPTKAAEIMLECSNYFLVNSSGLNIGRGFSALSADEDLEFGSLYIMFPMRRLNSIVMAADMAVVLLVAKRISGSGNVRISLVVGKEAATAASSAIESVESPMKLETDDLDIFPGEEHKYRSSVSRSRKPMLDTIFEEPVLSR